MFAISVYTDTYTIVVPTSFCCRCALTRHISRCEFHCRWQSVRVYWITVCWREVMPTTIPCANSTALLKRKKENSSFATFHWRLYNWLFPESQSTHWMRVLSSISFWFQLQQQSFVFEKQWNLRRFNYFVRVKASAKRAKGFSNVRTKCNFRAQNAISSYFSRVHRLTGGSFCVGGNRNDAHHTPTMNGNIVPGRMLYGLKLGGVGEWEAWGQLVSASEIVH